MEMLNNHVNPAVPSMMLCALLTAALTACGGGTAGETIASAASETTALSEVSTASLADTPTTPDSAALAVRARPAPKTTKLAVEGGSFTVSNTQVVRYGVDSRWTQKSVTGSGNCTNSFFGTDPAFGTIKGCELVTTTSTGPAVIPVIAPAPSVPMVTAWVRLAQENESFVLTGTQNIRIGDGSNWVAKTGTDSGTCSVQFFGSDPAWGKAKFCEVQLTVPGVIQTGLMPVVNTALIPKPALAYDSARRRALSIGELANPGNLPALNEIGAFREACNFSHMSFDDPIVYPGQPGKSHLHTFLGNSAAGAASTGDSLMNSGGSTCAGGTLNRTAYWMPTLIDIRTGQPLVPSSANFYYKQGYYGVAPGTMRPFPKGLRMIAGDSTNVSPVTSPNIGLECTSGGGHKPSMPNCAVGDSVNISVIFPQCWDGINLDSPDHKSHMAYATGAGCPTTHPVPLPDIALNVHYVVDQANAPTFWRFSSDNYAGVGGHSLHADWFNGWDSDTNISFLNGCVNIKMDCHNFLLGDGTMLY